MSELQNPLFDEEKEFLERKKLEYERALRGDVDHIKDQSVKVGKVALVGAGLAGSVWLISKLMGGKKRKRKAKRHYEDDYETDYASFDERDSDQEYADTDNDYEFGANYYASASGRDQHGDDGLAHKSAAHSAQAFMDSDEQNHEADDLGLGSIAVHADAAAEHNDGGSFDTEEFEDDPFQDLPYDDSRRLPTSHAFDGGNADGAAPKGYAAGSGKRLISSVLQAFLQSDTGKVLVAQAAAVIMAVVTKKIGEVFPADKNADLATSPGYNTAETGAVPVASPAPSVSLTSDALNSSQSL
jgi:hypothetical protein